MSRLFVFFLVRCRSKLAPILAWPISNELINMGFYSFSNYTHSVGIIVFADFSTPSFQTSPRSLYSRNKAYFLGTPALSSFFFKFAKLQVKPITAQSSQYCFVIGCALNQSQPSDRAPKSRAYPRGTSLRWGVYLARAEWLGDLWLTTRLKLDRTTFPNNKHVLLLLFKYQLWLINFAILWRHATIVRSAILF